MDNATLEALGMNGSEMYAYWQDKAQRIANDKTDSNRQLIKDAYNQAIIDLQTIQDTVNPTNAQVVAGLKTEATILQKLLKYLKAEIT